MVVVSIPRSSEASVVSWGQSNAIDRSRGPMASFYRTSANTERSNHQQKSSLERDETRKAGYVERKARVCKSEFKTKRTAPKRTLRYEKVAETRICSPRT